MIEQVVKNWEANKEAIRADLATKHPERYKSLVEIVIKHVGKDIDYDDMDWKKIHEIDDGDYQGTLVFVIPCEGYQPYKYWSVLVSYGSCSGCDTLQAIQNYEDTPPSKKQVDQYMSLALHIVQAIKPMYDQ